MSDANRDRARTLVAKLTDRDLFRELKKFDGLVGDKARDHALAYGEEVLATYQANVSVRAWLIEEVERRYPAAAAAVEAAFEKVEAYYVAAGDENADYPTVDYVGVLLNAVTHTEV